MPDVTVTLCEDPDLRATLREIVDADTQTVAAHSVSPTRDRSEKSSTGDMPEKTHFSVIALPLAILEAEISAMLENDKVWVPLAVLWPRVARTATVVPTLRATKHCRAVGVFHAVLSQAVKPIPRPELNAIDGNVESTTATTSVVLDGKLLDAIARGMRS